MTPFSETRRQVVHIGSAAFALLLPVLTWWQAALMALLALLFNLFALPRIGGRRLFRAADEVRGYPVGILLYPISVLLLIVIFPQRPDIVAAAWGILAFGDGCATLFGRRFGEKRLPWNSDKTWIGTCAFALWGAAGGIALSAWARTGMTLPPTMTAVTVATIAAALAATFAETVPSRLDDNLAVPAVAALVLWGCSFMEPPAGGAIALLINRRLVEAFAINAVVGWAGWYAASVSVSGALAGMTVGIAIYLGAGPAGWGFLFASFVAAVIASRMGLKRKTLLGIAQESGGRRGAGNAFANCGLAAFAAVIAMSTSHREAALLVVVTALTAGASDTIASEIGKAWGRRTFLSIGFRLVPPGTSGAVSLEGTAAGIVAATALAMFAALTQLIDPQLVWIVVAAAFAGSVGESFLGATLEHPGILNNDQLNFINTAIAGGVALVLTQAVV
jgi:uncharacterized protein (TIGR00297 family)